MLKALRIIVQNGSIILFLVLQSLCLYWVIRYNQNQQKIYLYSSQKMANAIISRFNNAKGYLNLKTLNQSLLDENARILALQLNKSHVHHNPNDSSQEFLTIDSLNYKVIACRVINNSVDKRNNWISLNKGGKDGIKPGMGVITSKGIVGVVTDTSHQFSLVMSVLHSKSHLSAKLKRSGFFGPLEWNGRQADLAQLEHIQKYADIRLGDTVVTSGYSLLFPENHIIGTVHLYKINAGSFTFNIDVKLSQTLSNISEVYVISNPFSSQLQKLDRQALEYE
ncbi:MAG: rod shape-determining protein MreC [Bacteroidota bacterium]|nr:rod shape-determining protein MreC [Bacteroidota bacterium]